MTGAIVVSIGAILACGWGVAHLFATRGVVSGFGEISSDNRRIIMMEWITEGGVSGLSRGSPCEE